jgi:hypothetical protein
MSRLSFCSCEHSWGYHERKSMRCLHDGCDCLKYVNARRLWRWNPGFSRFDYPQGRVRSLGEVERLRKLWGES